MLNVNNLKYQFSSQVLFSNLTFKLEKGEILFLLGKNGSGKTTLLKCISGIISSSNNAISYSEIPPPLYLSAQMELHSGLTAIDIFDLFEVKKSKWYEESLLSQFEIKDLLNTPVEQLSSGERQRILLMAGLFYNSNLVLLDEPLSFLDISFYFKFQDVLRFYLKKGRSFIVSNHDLPFSSSFVDSKTLLILDGEQFIFDKTHKVLNDKRLHSLFNINISEVILNNTKNIVLNSRMESLDEQ